MPATNLPLTHYKQSGYHYLCSTNHELTELHHGNELDTSGSEGGLEGGVVMGGRERVVKEESSQDGWRELSSNLILA